MNGPLTRCTCCSNSSSLASRRDIHHPLFVMRGNQARRRRTSGIERKLSDKVGTREGKRWDTVSRMRSAHAVCFSVPSNLAGSNNDGAKGHAGRVVRTTNPGGPSSMSGSANVGEVPSRFGTVASFMWPCSARADSARWVTAGRRGNS